MTEEAPRTRQPNPVVQVGWKMSAVFALVLGTFLIVGLILPGTWSAEASVEIHAPPEVVFGLLEEPREWDRWVAGPEVDFSYAGPPRGVGASRTWDEPQVGSGSFTVTEARRPTLVGYQVDLEGGRLVTQGMFWLERTPAGVRVTWREAGDFGSNPLLAWAAVAMNRKHATELGLRLRDLATVAEGGALPLPARTP